MKTWTKKHAQEWRNILKPESREIPNLESTLIKFYVKFWGGVRQ